jgi:3',5'-cyclic AMP phosphodiesterase CpdA
VRLLQLSDVHFGRHAVPAYHEAVARRIAEGRYEVVVVAGDLTQRNRIGQFRAARSWLDAARRHAEVLTVMGNHDVAWWWKPLGIGAAWPMYRKYRKWIHGDLEPVLRRPGLTMVGLHSSHGVRPFTMTTRLKDVSIVGKIRPEQWEHARTIFAAAPAGDLKVLVFHHNLLRGDLSGRWGLANRDHGIGEALGTGADLVMNGHDHQTRIDSIELGSRRMVVSASTTLCGRTRGGLPAAFQEIEVTSTELRIRSCAWESARGDFAPRQDRVFPR